MKLKRSTKTPPTWLTLTVKWKQLLTNRHTRYEFNHSNSKRCILWIPLDPRSPYRNLNGTNLGPGDPPFPPMGACLATTVTLPSCPIPESLTGSGDFEDYLQQFNTAAMLSGRYSSRHDHHPQYFALQLRENVLHFYTTLSLEQQNDHDIVDAFS